MHWQTISPESIRWKWIEVVTANHPNAKTISLAHETNWDLSNSKHKDSANRIIRNKHTLFNFGRASIASLPVPYPQTHWKAVHLPSPQRVLRVASEPRIGLFDVTPLPCPYLSPPTTIAFGHAWFMQLWFLIRFYFISNNGRLWRL